jgi:uncharacterized protein (TIGR00369 family)
MTCKERIQESFDKQSFLTLIGARLEEAEPGRVAISCRRREDLCQQQGLLHGGVTTSIADVTCGYTALTVMPEEMEVLTVEFKINILRPVLSDRIVATGEVVKAGRRLVITEATVRDAESGAAVAKMMATMIPTPKGS